MGLLKDMAAGYATAASAHTGLHYVPSFNDLNSGANDDLEEEVLVAERRSHTLTMATQPMGIPVPPPATSKHAAGVPTAYRDMYSRVPGMMSSSAPMGSGGAGFGAGRVGSPPMSGTPPSASVTMASPRGSPGTVGPGVAMRQQQQARTSGRMLDSDEAVFTILG